MRRKRRATIDDLRLAIAALPHATRVAMLDGIRANEIIAGAYASEQGICPMLAAHRGGGRTSSISFARAWDAFVFRGARRKAARRATTRELLVLSAQLEASLLAEEASLVPGADRASVPASARRPRGHGLQTRNRRHPAPLRAPRRRPARARTQDSTSAYLLRGGTGGAHSGRGAGRAER